MTLITPQACQQAVGQNWSSVESAYNDICMGDPKLVLSSDASLIGWGWECEGVTAGQWLPAEQAYHISYLAVKAAFFGTDGWQQWWLALITWALSCNSITQETWQWCIACNVWISTAHIPGKDNKAADLESRRINLDAEWKVGTEMLRSASLALKIDPQLICSLPD